MSSSRENSCGKCGFCLSVCPVYKAEREEQVSPRAKVQLIKSFSDKGLSSSPFLQNLISKCLMCGSCSAICPSEVNHYAQFMDMREQMAKDHGERLEIKGLTYLLAREQRLKMVAGIARVGQGILPETFKRKYSLANIPLSSFPELNSKPFRSAVPENIAPSGRERGVVLYFTGCATNHIFDSTGLATVEMLSKMGYRVIIPKDQVCCSIPMLFHGAIDQAKTNILKNIELFNQENIEAVIVDCPTCGSALKNEYPAMMERYGYAGDDAEKLSEKVTDLLSFVYERLNILRGMITGGGNAPAVTYHTPCHLRNSFISAERVLAELKEINYVPAVDNSECCGGGGTFFYEYPEVSRKIAATKIINARSTGAQVWLTDCPVCRINLAGQIPADVPLKMAHPITFLAGLIK